MQPRILIATAVAAVLVAPAAAPAQTPEYVKPETSMGQPREPQVEPESGRLDTSGYYRRDPAPEPEPEPEFRPLSCCPRVEQETEPETRASQLLNGRQHALTKKEAVEYWIIIQGGIIHTDVQNPADPSHGYFIYVRPHGAGTAIAPY